MVPQKSITGTKERVSGGPSNRSKKGRRKNSAPPQGADGATLAAFEANALDESWIRSSGRVHFSISGVAKKVDDKTRLDLPPDTLVA